MRCASTWRTAPLRNRRTAHGLLAPIVLLLAALVLIAGCAAGATVGSAGGSQRTATTATFTATDQSRLAAAVNQAMTDETSRVQTQYGTNRTVQTTITIGWTATYTADDVPREQERVKGICFAAQKALWTSGVALTDALVIVIGPVTDEYGSPTTDAHGTAELSAPTASRLSWETLGPDTAWTRYDHTYLRDTYTFSA